LIPNPAEVDTVNDLVNTSHEHFTNRSSNDGVDFAEDGVDFISLDVVP
jgi:hypothetical protein